MSDVFDWLCRSCFMPRGWEDERDWRRMYGIPPTPTTVCPGCGRQPSAEAIAASAAREQAGLLRALAASAQRPPDGNSSSPERPGERERLTHPPGMLTIEEAGERLGCRRTRVFELLQEARLTRAGRVGRATLVTVASVEGYQASRLPPLPAPKRERKPRPKPSAQPTNFESSEQMAAELARRRARLRVNGT